METKLATVAVILIVLGIGFGIAAAQHRHDEDCKWIAPLQTQYVMCSDGKVRLK